MVIAPVLWSTAGVVTRHMERASAFEQVFWRSAVCFLFVGGFLFVSKSKPNVLSRLTLLSGALWAVMFTTFVIALSLTSTANTLVVMSVSPLLTSLLAWAVLREAMPVRTWIAAGASAIGICWMAFAADAGVHGARDVAGMLVASSVPIASAVNLVTLRIAARGGQRVDLMPAVMLGGLFSAIVALPIALPLDPTAKDLALLSFLGVFQLGLPCMLLVVAARVLPPAEIALLGLLEVVLGVLWTWLFAGEQPGAATLLGGAIVLAALVLNEISTMREKPV